MYKEQRNTDLLEPLCTLTGHPKRPTGLVGELARWQKRVEEFVLGRVGAPPARVLEVGCGEGGWPGP